MVWGFGSGWVICSNTNILYGLDLVADCLGLVDFPMYMRGVGDGIWQDTSACYDFLFAFAFLRAGKPLLR